MKFLLLLLAAPVWLSETCNDKKEAEKMAQVPTCIQAKIDTILNNPRWNPPAQVNEYSYKGKRVFLFSAPCCDQYEELFDENCTYLCAPSGGFTGRGDSKCPDFKDSATFVKLVWKDER